MNRARVPLSRPSPNPASGFVLVGVIMFILVLTILGLSLFSLSGFEAQFFNTSLSRQESFHLATGGIERSKWVLMKTGSLNKVRDDLPPGVTYAVARQGVDFETGDSLGSVVWNGDPVWIRVLAESRGTKSFLEGQYTPVEPQDIYRQLITSHSGLTITASNNSPYSGPPDDPTRWKKVYLNGRVWQNSANLGWRYTTDPAGPLKGSYSWTIGGVPAPDVSGFIAAHLALANPVSLSAGASDLDLDLGSPSGPPVYYTTATHVHNLAAQVDIHVQGTAIWLLQDGIQIQGKLSVERQTSADRLIIVSHGKPSASFGISLGAIIKSQDVPLFLVTDSQLEIMHDWGPYDDTQVPYLSIFAEGVTLMGPRVGVPSNVHRMTLTHDSNLDDAVLTPLYDLGALPNTAAGAARTLPLKPGTWRPLSTNGLN